MCARYACDTAYVYNNYTHIDCSFRLSPRSSSDKCCEGSWAAVDPCWTWLSARGWCSNESTWLPFHGCIFPVHLPIGKSTSASVMQPLWRDPSKWIEICRSCKLLVDRLKGPRAVRLKWFRGAWRPRNAERVEAANWAESSWRWCGSKRVTNKNMPVSYCNVNIDYFTACREPWYRCDVNTRTSIQRDPGLPFVDMVMKL